MARDDATLLDILKACRLALEFSANMDRADAVDAAEVWRAVSTDVPRLLEALTPLAPKPRG